MKHLVLVFLFVCSLTRIWAQSSDYEFELDFTEYQLQQNSDYSLFLLLGSDSQSLFDEVSRYNFSVQRYLRRGYNYDYHPSTINGVSLNDALSIYPYFSLVNMARGINNSALGTDYSLWAGDAPTVSRASLGYVNRNSPLSSRVLYTSTLSEKYPFMCYANIKTGRDEQIDGLWGEYYTGAASVDIDDFSVFVGVNYSKYSSRSSATEEVFALTEDNLYNPSWGYFEGEMISSRYNERFQPNLMFTFRTDLSSSLKLEASLSSIFSCESYCSLAWDDALSPYPDYYQWLPSFLDEGDVKNQVTEQWKSGNTALTQIDWQALMQSNQNSGERALYYMQKQTQDKLDINLRAALSATTDYGVELTCGAEYRAVNSWQRKTLDDALGSDYVVSDSGDIVAEGDVFDYDNSYCLNDLAVFGALAYVSGGLDADLGVRVGYQNYFRSENYYSSEDSRSVSFSPYDVNLRVGYTFNPKHRLVFSLGVGARVPYADDVFTSHYYSNNLIVNPELKTMFRTELSYRLRLQKIKVELTAYATAFNNEMLSYSYYDDIYSQYASLKLSGLSSQHLGAELAVQYDLSRGWSLISAVSLNRYTYSSSAQLRIYASDSGYELGSVQTAYMEGYHVPNTPQFLASVELKYSGAFGWIASLKVSHTAESYVRINPLRRTSKVTNAAYYSELKDELTTQECLPSATTLSVFVYRSFELWGQEFYVTLSVDNLLGSSVIYSGYEQMRLGVEGSGLSTCYTPFDNKYLYSYSRTYRANLTYKF